MVIIWKTYYFNNKYGTRITHENSKTYFQLGPLKVYGKYFVFITVLRNVVSWACGHCLFYFLLAHWICDCPGLKAINGVSTLLAANWNTWTPFLYRKMVTLNGKSLVNVFIRNFVSWHYSLILPLFKKCSGILPTSW